MKYIFLLIPLLACGGVPLTAEECAADLQDAKVAVVACQKIQDDVDRAICTQGGTILLNALQRRCVRLPSLDGRNE